MSEEKSSFTKDIEELVSKSIEANKIFLTEGTRLVKQFGNKKGDQEKINIFQPELISNVFNAYTKLNIQHLKNVIDLGISLVKQTGTKGPEGNFTKEGKAEEAAPAFVLKASVYPATDAVLQFLLDNTKEQEVSCRLVNTDYTKQSNPPVQCIFKTSFSPQSFVLKPAASQTVNIDISIPANAGPGVYICNVQVQGFEPAYFSIYLTIIQKQSKTPANDRRKGK